MSGFPSELVWTQPPQVPLDRDGPVDLPTPDLPPDFTERPIAALLADVMARRPDAIAVCDRSLRLTYADVAARADMLSRRIAAAVPAGSAVGLMLPAASSQLVAILGCLMAGRPCLLFDLHLPPERLAGMVRGAAPRAIVHDGITPWLPDGIPCLRVDDATAAPPSSASPAAPGEPAVVVYTSGSSGQPKGIVQSQRGILCRARQMIDAWHMHPGDVFMSLSVPGTIAGLTCFAAALLTGTRQVIVDLQQDSVRDVLAMARREDVTILAGFPNMLRLLISLGEPRTQLPRLRVVRTAGGALTAADAEAWRKVLPPACRLMTTFGSTESMTFAQRFVPDRHERDSTRLPVGYPLADHMFTVVDAEHRPVRPGEIGELVVRSRNIAIGEWIDGRCIPGRLLPDPADPEQRILYTGDLVRLRADGLLEFIERRDAQVKIRGQRVEPDELEDQIRLVDGVTDVAVVVRRNGEDVALQAFIVVDRELSEQRLRDELRRRLPEYMLPSRISFVERLPRLASGKVDRRAL